MYYGMGMIFDPTMIIILPAIILSAVAQMKISSSFSKYSSIPSSKGMKGVDVARELLRISGITDVEVEVVNGRLSDHYDPRTKKVRLSKDVYYSNSIASISVAAHEVGHAIQHYNGYLPLDIRSAIAPIAAFSSRASWFLITLGLVFGFLSGSILMLEIGIFLFTAVVIFQIITLPVEFNASKRALNMLEDYSFLENKEINGSKSVLSAAALTYVAAALTGISQLLRLIVILNNRRD